MLRCPRMQLLHRSNLLHLTVQSRPSNYPLARIRVSESATAKLYHPERILNTWISVTCGAAAKTLWSLKEWIVFQSDCNFCSWVNLHSCHLGRRENVNSMWPRVCQRDIKEAARDLSGGSRKGTGLICRTDEFTSQKPSATCLYT